MNTFYDYLEFNNRNNFLLEKFKIDKYGYIFFKNIHKGEIIPTEEAKRLGFILPKFKIGKPISFSSLSKREKKVLNIDYEGVYIKEGIKSRNLEILEKIKKEAENEKKNSKVNPRLFITPIA